MSQSKQPEYTLTTQGEVKTQKFTDPKQAAAAFQRTDPSKKPTMILAHSDGSAQFVGTTSQSLDKEGAPKYVKSVSLQESAAQFRQEYERIESFKGLDKDTAEYGRAR